MPKFLEDKLKQEYGVKSDIPYKIMNAKGYMHGNKETAKGEALDAKHSSDMKMKVKPRIKKKVIAGAMAAYSKK